MIGFGDNFKSLNVLDLYFLNFKGKKILCLFLFELKLEKIGKVYYKIYLRYLIDKVLFI